MTILLGNLSAKAGRKDIFKPSVGNERAHEISKDNGVRVQRDVLTGLADRIGLACHMVQFLVFHVHAITFNSQNLGFTSQITRRPSS